MNPSSTSNSSSNRYKNNIAAGTACNGTRYTIKKGDTLYSISRQYDVPLAMILRANPYVDVYNLQIGQSICIPTEAPIISSPGTPQRPLLAEGPGAMVRPSRAEDSAPIMYNDSPAVLKEAEESVSVMPKQNRKQTETVVKRPVPSMPPVSNGEKTTQVRRTMPIVQKRPMPMEMASNQQNMPVRRTMSSERIIPRNYMEMEEARPARKAKAAIPVRIINKEESSDCMESEKERCGRWCSYQDKERFKTIMNYEESNNKTCCRKVPSCTQNITKPESNTCYKKENPYGQKDDNSLIVSYVSKDNDTLQDILDYFTMDIVDLFQYNVPDTIHLKPGCMIRVPGKSDDR